MLLATASVKRMRSACIYDRQVRFTQNFLFAGATLDLCAGFRGDDADTQAEA